MHTPPHSLYLLLPEVTETHWLPLRVKVPLPPH